MTLFSRRLVALVASISALVAKAGEIRVPPITGQLSGEVTPLKIVGVPPLHWTAEVNSGETGKDPRKVEARFEGTGTRVVVAGNFTTTEDGTWKILEGEISLATWFPVAATVVGDALQGMNATGTVKFSGEGTVQKGEPSGTIRIALSNGRIESRDGWTLEAVALTGQFAVAMPGPRVRSVEPFELTVGAISTYRFGARNLTVHGFLNEDRTVKLDDVAVEMAGGKITMDPTTLRLSPLVVETTLRIMNVGLQDVAALVPYGLSESRGRIDGTLRIGWKDPDGLSLGAGVLNLNTSEPATVRLMPQPGFLTRKMPARFGPIANPVYPDMVEIEQGLAPLLVDSLTVQVTPDGDEHGRSATIRMTAHPSKAKAGVKKLTFDVNVSGPLADVITLGLKGKENISFGTH